MASAPTPTATANPISIPMRESGGGSAWPSGRNSVGNHLSPAVCAGRVPVSRPHSRFIGYFPPVTTSDRMSRIVPVAFSIRTTSLSTMGRKTRAASDSALSRTRSAHAGSLLPTLVLRFLKLFALLCCKPVNLMAQLVEIKSTEFVIMCMGASPPSPPPPPPPPPEPPRKVDRAVQKARGDEKKAALLASGRAGTILTGGSSLQDRPRTGKKDLLGS